jgi:formate hydrogenlyase transcriptional activator
MTTPLRVAARYSTILEINRAAITQPSLKKVFQGTCEAVKKVIPYDRMGLSLFAPEDGTLRVTAATGQGFESFYQVGLVLDCKLSHHGWVFRHQKPIVRRDLQRELEFQTEQPNVEEGIRSYCAVPLIARGESVGVIIVLSSERNSYAGAHAEFLQEVSDQFVLAVKSLNPTCPDHSRTRLVCPRCIASGGGLATAAKHKERLSDWGRQGGRGRKKPAGGLTDDILS